MKRSIIAILVVLSTNVIQAQKAKVQTAWRALSDYESTVKDGKPDLSYLTKAKEAIEIALTNEDTKKQGKTYAYKARIMYGFYNHSLLQEMKKLEATVTDKKEQAELAYGNTPTTDFEEAQKAVDQIEAVDPKFIKNIQDGFTGKTQLSEDDAKFMQVALMMKMEAGNIAGGKYKAKKYDEAADYFYKVGHLNMALSGKKDTANFYNACICAGRSKNASKILEYNKKMIDLKIATPYNYNSIFQTSIEKKDTAAALDILTKGREAFPNDANLLKYETYFYLARGKSDEALASLDLSIEKDPTNALLYLTRAGIYDKKANPKDAKGKDTEKPANFDELFKKAEADYTKAIELKPKTNEDMYNAYFNFGAMYNNNGSYFSNKANDVPLKDIKTKGKEYENQAKDSYKKAIPLLENALKLNETDVAVMQALRQLYFLVNDQPKAIEMTNRIKASGGK